MSFSVSTLKFGYSKKTNYHVPGGLSSRLLTLSGCKGWNTLDIYLNLFIFLYKIFTNWLPKVVIKLYVIRDLGYIFHKMVNL